MLRRFCQNSILSIKLLRTSNIQVRSSLSTSSPALLEQKWDLYAGILLERLPIISKEFNKEEQEFQEYLWAVEFENSLKSDHELKHENDLKQAELVKKGKAEVDLDDTSSKQTAQDLEDAYTEELKAFTPAPRQTEDDRKNSFTSTNRCLDEILYLLVEQKLGDRAHLLLPQGPRKDGETMRQTAERVLREKCGDKIQANFSSNAPCGFYKYKYPKSMQSEVVGAKVFFYRATLAKGNVDNDIATKYEWLTGPIMCEKLNSDFESYERSIRKFLL